MFIVFSRKVLKNITKIMLFFAGPLDPQTIKIIFSEK